jgi:hypothetical protein
LGKISDYEFDEQSGILENITYVRVNGTMESLNFSDVIDNSKEAIRIKTPDKPAEPKIEDAFDSSDEDFFKEPKLGSPKQTNSVGPDLGNVTKQAEDLLNAFKRDLEERKNRFYKFCDSLEAEVRSHADGAKFRLPKFESENAHERNSPTISNPVESIIQADVAEAKPPEEIASTPKNAAVEWPSKNLEGGSRKDLEKLYELQRKRMSILKKL